MGNEVKINAILKAVGKAGTLIDIGCSRGYMAKAFLDNNQVSKCYGLNPEIEIVSPELLKNPAFTFYKANLVDFVFPQNYEVVIYTAVHHRVFETYGRDIALNVWKKVIDACDKTVVFETGMLVEKGDDFVSELAKHYASDSEYLDEVFSVVGNRLLGVDEIIKLPVRGATRTVYKLTLSEARQC
jgi:hypothetical protein